jgi:outer membrane protein assembly factor BamB
MPQRWMKYLAFFTAATLLISACRKSEFSKDEKLPETFSSSLFITSQNQFLYALNPTTGKKQWEYNVDRHVESTPVVIGDFLYIPTADTLIKIDAKRGKEIKKYWYGNSNFFKFASSPTINGAVMYIGSLNDTMYALNTVDDQIIWKTPVGTGGIVSSPTIYNNLLIFGAGNTVTALDIANNGAISWQFTAGGKVTSSPVVSDPFVFVGSHDGKMNVLNANTGVLVWDYATSAPILSSPIVYGGNLIFGSNNNNLYCIDTAARKERWIFKTEDRVVSSPVADRNTIYFGSYDYNFYALNVIDGQEKWRYKTNALIKASPLIHNGIVYFGSHDKHMYALDSSGVLQWKHNVNGLIESSPVIWDLQKAYYPTISGLSPN